MRYLLIVFIFSSFVLASQLQKVSLQLQWKHQFEFAGFYAAKEKGFYEDIGVDISFLEYNGKGSIVKKVINNEVNFALSYSSIIASYLNGDNIKLVANYLKQSPLVLVTQKDIKTPKDLHKKKVMGVSDDIDSITLKLMLEKFDINLDDIKSIPTTFRVDDFINKKVDAMALFTTNEIYELDKKGIQYNLFNPSLYGHEYYDLNLFTSTEFSRQNRRLVENFKKASKKGWRYALEHKEEIIELILKKYNTQNKTREALMFEAKQIEHLMLTKTETIGSIDPLRLELIAKSFIEAGYADSSKLSLLDNFIFSYSEFNTNFTKEERAFLDQNPVIKIYMDYSYPPYSFVENNKIKGFSFEYAELLSKLLGVKFEYITNITWNEALQNLKDKKIDLIGQMVKTKDRSKFALFTDNYYSYYTGVLTKKRNTHFTSLQKLQGKTVGLVKGYYEEELLRRHHPEIKIKTYKDTKQLLSALLDDQFDAIIQTYQVSEYLMHSKNLTENLINIPLAIEPIFGITKEAFGIRKDWSLLQSTLNKVILLTQVDRDNIEKRWLSDKKRDTELLTKKEKEFLKQHPKIVLGTSNNWEPYSIRNTDGTISGYDQDILNFIKQKTGANFVLKQGNWSHIQKLALDKKIEGLATLTKTAKRDKFLNFSNIYISLIKNVMVKDGNPLNIRSIKDLEGKKIAIHKGNVADEKIVKNIKNAIIIYKESPLAVLKEVMYGEADATFGNGATEYLISKKGLPYMTNAFALDKSLDLRFAIRKDWPEAISIINKALANISKHEKTILFKKWFYNDQEKSIELSQKEQIYLDNKKHITMCVDPDWDPYEQIDKNGKHVGLVSDFIKLIERKIDKKIQLIPTKTWTQSIEFAKKGKCEILSFLNKTPQRSQFLNFTPSIYNESEVIVARDHVPFIEGLNDLDGKVVGIVKGYKIDSYIKNYHPNIKVRYIKNYEKGLRLVSEGKIYAAVNSLLGTAHLIQKHHLLDIKIAGKTKLDNVYRIGVIKSEPILRDILSKAALDISKKDKDSILSNWISVKFENMIDYTLVFQILIGSFIFMCIFIYWGYTLKIENKKRVEAEEKLTKLNAELEEEVKASIKEIQAQDKLLQQQTRLAQMGEMIAMIAHQWRQPIGAINSAIIAMNFKIESKKEKLKDSHDSIELLSYIEKKSSNISNYVHFLSTTIDDFRNFFKPDKQKELISLDKVIQDTFLIIEASLKTKCIDIKTNFKAPTQLMLYKNEMIQVLLNILKNAEDQLTEKKIENPTIIISAVEDEKECCVKICDNSGGIDEKIIPNIFDPYFSTKDEKNGTGLGLYISKTIIVEHHQGDLIASNENNNGCFTIILKKDKLCIKN